MVLKFKVVKTVAPGTKVKINLQGSFVFSEEKWVGCIGVIKKVHRDGKSASVVFPGVKETRTRINKRYLDKYESNKQEHV